MADLGPPPELPSWVVILPGWLVGLFGAFAAFWTAFRAKRATAATTEKLEAETDEKRAATSKDLFEEVERLRGLYLKTSRAEEQCHARCEHLEARIKILEALVPMAYGARLLRNLGTLRKIFEQIRDPLLMTSKVGGGTILWANPAFCRALGRSLEEIIALGWKGLVHPDDLDETIGMETLAWDSPVEDFVNRFVRADGSIIHLRWLCSPYDDNGVTLARVEVARVDPPLGERP